MKASTKLSGISARLKRAISGLHHSGMAASAASEGAASVIRPLRIKIRAKYSTINRASIKKEFVPPVPVRRRP